MATILTQEDEENKQQSLSAPLTQSGGIQGDSLQNAGPAPAQAVQPKPQGSGRFTNLQKYLGANQQAGDKLAGGIRKKGDEYIGSVREGIDSAQGVQQGIQGERSRIGQAGQLAQGIQDDAINVAQNNLQDVTQLRLGQNQANQLQGQGTQAIQTLSSGISPLDQFGQNLGNESGRFQVLQDTFGGSYKPNYNMGQRRLDQLFLQAAPDDQLNQLQTDIGSTVGQANQSLSALGKDLNTGIGDIRYGAQNAQRDILGAIGSFDPDQRGAFGSLYQDLGTEQGVRKTELQSNVDKARAQLGTGRLSQDMADMLGLSGGTGYGVMDLGSYADKNINLGDTDVTMADVLDRNDYSGRLNALAQLSGTQTGDYDIGEKSGSDIGFNKDAFTSEAARNVAEYEDEVFKKSLYDALGMYNPQTGEAFKAGDTRQSVEDFEKERRDTTVSDLMDQYRSSVGSSDGIINVGGWGGTAADDTTSRQQLQNDLDYAKRMYSPKRNWYQRDINQFNQLLNYLDSNRENQLQIDDSVSDLEGGGMFNVT